MNTSQKIVFVIVSIVFSLNVGCAKPIVVEGLAMSPTLKNGDKILLNQNIENLQRGDIISFKYPKDTNKWFIKRIIGMPNEEIEIKNGIVFINGEEINEPYLERTYNQAFPNYQKSKIPENEYFVMGDNRDNSSDSRIWGTVNKGLITGKFWMTYSQKEKK